MTNTKNLNYSVAATGAAMLVFLHGCKTQKTEVPQGGIAYTCGGDTMMGTMSGKTPKIDPKGAGDDGGKCGYKLSAAGANWTLTALAEPQLLQELEAKANVTIIMGAKNSEIQKLTMADKFSLLVNLQGGGTLTINEGKIADGSAAHFQYMNGESSKISLGSAFEPKEPQLANSVVDAQQGINPMVSAQLQGQAQAAQAALANAAQSQAQAPANGAPPVKGQASGNGKPIGVISPTKPGQQAPATTQEGENRAQSKKSAKNGLKQGDLSTDGPKEGAPKEGEPKEEAPKEEAPKEGEPTKEGEQSPQTGDADVKEKPKEEGKANGADNKPDDSAKTEETPANTE